MTQYYIAWHPEYKGNPPGLHLEADRAQAEAAIREAESFPLDEGTMQKMWEHAKRKGWQIKPVHLVESDKVREMWGALQDLNPDDFPNRGWVRTVDVVTLLQSILPEPTEAKEKVNE